MHQEKRREASTSTFEADLLQEDRYIECISSDGQVFNVNGMFVAAKQFQIYEHRPTELEDMCFLSFCICTELVEIKDGTPLPAPEEERKNGARKLNQRLRLLPASPLESAYIVMIHSKFKVPILAGQPPPECPPVDEETEAAKKGRKRWALFWGTALLPWRDRNLVSCDDAAFFSWILRSLKEPSGSINRAKALFCLSTTFMSRKTVLHSKCLDLWRYRNAAILTEKDAVATNRTSEEQDEAVLQDIAAIADQLVIGMGRSGEDSHAQNIRRQVECMLPEQRTTAAVPTRKTCIFNNSAILTECCKSVETFEDSTAMTNQATDGEERHQIPQLIPDTPQLSEELNAQQVALINKVYAAVKEKRQALIFVQGEAGTGKTFCVKEMYNCLSKHFGQNCLRCLAPTGVSAENLLKGTLTIHKGLCIDPKRNRVDRLPANKQPVLHMRYDGTLVFVVDEISMVSPALLLRISQRLKELALLCGAENPASDFGGFTVVLMGDFLQIPPVRSKSLLEEALYPSSGPTTLDVFLGGLLFRKFELIVFTQQMRAQEVGQKTRVNILREGKITAALLDSIKELNEDDLKNTDWTFLVATNEERHALNDALGKRFAALKGVPIIKWHNSLGGSIVNNAPQDLLDAITDFVPELTGTFIQDAPAMILNNFSPSCGLANGSMCTMIALGGVTDETDIKNVREAAPASVVWLSMPPSHVIVCVKALEVDENIPRMQVGKKYGVPLKLCPDSKELPKAKTDNKARSVSFSWHYIALAFAFTLHKCQGKTLQKVVLCLEQSKNTKLTFEQVLVGITRVRSADDLRILPCRFSRQKVWKTLTNLAPAPAFKAWFDPAFFPGHALQGMRQFDTMLDEQSEKRGKKRQREEKLEPVRKEAEAVKKTATKKDLAKAAYLRSIRKSGTFVTTDDIDKAIRIITANLSTEFCPSCKFMSGTALQLLYLRRPSEPWEAKIW